MAIELNDNIKINAGKPSDYWYLNPATNAVWPDVATVNATIPIGFRSPRLVVSLPHGNYWYDGGVADGNLVPVDEDVLAELQDLQTQITDLVAGKADKINNTQNTAVLFWENGIGEDLAGFYYDRTNKILNLKGALPTIRLMNADGSYISLERNVTANTFKLKNQVLQAGGIGRALRLNSSNTQYFNIPISPAIGVQHTITFWFKTTTSGVLFSNTSYSSGVTKFGEFSINSNTSVRIETDNGGTGAVTVNPTSFGITVLDGNWHFVAMCQETSTVKKTYIDNVLISSLNGSSLAGPLNSFAVGRGSSSGSTLYYTGSIDQFCVFNSVLSAANVAEIWNSGAGNGSLPVTPVRQYNFEEGAGVTVLDTIQSVTTVVQNANSAIWENIGKAPIQGSPQTATLLESNDGLTNGERGVCKVGEFNGSTILQGRYIKFLIDVYYFFVADIFGNVLIDSSNTSNSASPTAKLTVGAPTTTLAGLRLIAGVENTSTQNVGDVNHSAARRTFVKRKGTTGQTIKLSDVDTLFTGGYAALDDPTTTGSLLAINATYGGGNIIPANFLCLSKTIELELDGTIVAGSAGNAVIAVKLGAATIASFSVATADTVTASPFFLKVKIQDINVVGEVMVTGRFELNAATYKMIGSNGGQATGVNKTTALTLDVTGTLTGTTTGGSIRCLISTAKILN